MSRVYWVTGKNAQPVHVHYALQDFICPPGKPAMLISEYDMAEEAPKDPESTGHAFTGDEKGEGAEADAKMFIGKIPKEWQSLFSVNRKPVEFPVAELVDLPGIKGNFAENAPMMEYPDGEPDVNSWSRTQVMKFIRDFDKELHDFLARRPRLTTETAVLAYYEGHDKAKFAELRRLMGLSESYTTRARG